MQKPVKLITENPELLLYLDGKLHITVLGGIKLTGFVLSRECAAEADKGGALVCRRKVCDVT
jgi:hypothetical protein